MTQQLSEDEIFERLAAEFEPSELRTREADRGRRQLTYITARTARRRLNTVLGRAGWECRVKPTEQGVVCSLTIHLPTRSLTREAMGGYRDTNTSQDRSKSGDSDAFKRAAVLFGVGEYLYGEDEPSQLSTPAPASRPDRRPEPPRRDRDQLTRQYGNDRRADRPEPGPRESRDGGQPRTGKALWAWLREREEKHQAGAGLVNHVVEWGTHQGYPDRCFRWSFDQVKEGLSEAKRYLSPETALGNPYRRPERP